MSLILRQILMQLLLKFYSRLNSVSRAGLVDKKGSFRRLNIVIIFNADRDATQRLLIVPN